MSANAAQLYGKQYANNVQLRLQQKGGSRFGSAVMRGSHQGNQASPVDQVGAVEMQAVLTRFGAIGRTDAELTRRWVSPSDFHLNQNFDSFDKLKIISDPQSVYVMNAVNAAHRKEDDLIIDAMFAAALTGTSGATSVTAATDGVETIDDAFGASATTGLTVAKLKEARRILMANEVDLDEPLYCGMNAKAYDSLLNEAQVVSTDFNSRPVLVDGKLMGFLGFEFIISERFDNTADPYRRIPCWAKSGVHLGVWQEPKVTVSQRNDLDGQPYQAYLQMSMGATRLEGKKIVEIECSEA